LNGNPGFSNVVRLKKNFQVLILFYFYFQSLSSHTLGRQLSQFSYMEEEEETAIEFKENISEITKEAEGTSQTCYSDHVYLILLLLLC
jgi:hypothetical protein